MRTDEPLYVIFRHEPRWFFALANQPDPGPCEFRSEEFKSIARTCDGLIDPIDHTQGITIAEFQLTAGDNPYLRVAEEMLGAQRAAPDRGVQGFIFFGQGVRDPQLEPWKRLVTVLRFEEAVRGLAAHQPGHPLIHLLHPIVEESDVRLEQEGANHYHALLDLQKQGEITPVIPAVFVDLFWKRLSYKSREEINMMLLKDIPNMKDTVMGREIWDEGRMDILRGLIAAIASDMFGAFPEEIAVKVNQLTTDQLQALIVAMRKMESLNALTVWLNENAPID